MLLALVVDEVRNMTYTYAQSQQKNRIERPKQVPRPGTARARRAMSLEDAKRIDPRLRDVEDEDG